MKSKSERKKKKLPKKKNKLSKWDRLPKWDQDFLRSKGYETWADYDFQQHWVKRDFYRHVYYKPMSDSVKEIAKKRLLSKAKKDGSCVVWTGALNPKGCGRTSIGGQNWLVHRLSYMAYCGPIDYGVSVRQACGDRACIRPKHLYLRKEACALFFDEYDLWEKENNYDLWASRKSEWASRKSGSDGAMDSATDF